jgi:hypothetical protein
MNKIDVSFINDPTTEQPLTGPSLAFLQSGTSEIVAATIQSLIGDSPSASTPYILYGCVKTDLGGGNFSFTDGYIFYLGEVFKFPGITSIALPDTAVCNIVTTYDTIADPLEFSDGISRNVHQHRTIELIDGTSGSGDFNFDDARSLSSWLPKRFEVTLFDSTSHNPANNNLTNVYTFTATCDMVEFCFDVTYRCAISNAGNAGTIEWRILQNNTTRHLEAHDFPSVYSGHDVLHHLKLVMPSAYPILKGDVIELGFDYFSVSNPFATVYNVNLTASSNKTSNW